MGANVRNGRVRSRHMSTSPGTPRQTAPRRGKPSLGPFVSPLEAAKYLGLGKTKTYDLMKHHDLPWYELDGVRGRHIRVADLDRLIRRRTRLVRHPMAS